MDRPVTVACVQAEPVILDRGRTLDRLEELAAEAARNGAELVVFPETFVPVYPSSRWAKAFAGWQNDGAKATFARIAQNSIAVGSPEERRLGAAAKELGVWLVTGVNEVDPARPGTIYNALLYHSPDGELALHHRKLVPTNHERLIWGQGDGRGLLAVETGFGRVGGLVCWENYMPLARVALYESGVEIYIASTADDADEWQATLVHIARESRAYVVAPCHFQRVSSYPADFALASELDGAETLGRGGSAILAPNGSYLAGPLYDEEGILYAELDPTLLLAERQRFDPVGHYSRPDREDVDAVPLELLPVLLQVQRPLAHREVLARVQAARPEAHPGVVAEDRGDVLAHGIRALGPLCRGVVVEDDLGMVELVDRVDVLAVPRAVVALDQLGDLSGIHGDSVPRRRKTRSSPMRRVSPSASKRSSSSCAVFRPTPSRSRKRASAIRPSDSHVPTSVARACS